MMRHLGLLLTLTLTTALLVPVAPEAQSPGLVAAYGFEEPSGATVTDSSGMGNTGTISGATRTPGGRHGAALQFDGVDDWVTIANAAALNPTAALTLEAWVHPTRAGNWQTAVLKESSTQLRYALYPSSDNGRPSGWLRLSGDRSVYGPSALPLGTWTHLAVTYDGAAIRLYANGVQTASQTRTGTIATSTGALRIGGNAIWGEFFQGMLDEVRLYTRALTASEIVTDLNTPIVPRGAQLVITSPAPNAVLSGPSVSVRYSTSGVLTGEEDHVHFLLDGVTAMDPPPMDGTYEFLTVTAGVHTLGGYLSRANHSRIAGSDAVPVSFTVTGPDVTAPAVTQTSPTDAAVGVSPAATISATFSEPLSAATVNGTTITLLDSAGQSVPSTVTYEGATQRAVLTPGTSLSNAQPYTAVVKGGSAGVADLAGNVLPSDVAWTFTIAASPLPSAPGLVAAYSFDEGAGTTLNDLSGSANHGTIAGAAWSSSGRFGSALTFNGASNIVTVSDSPSLDLTNGMTLEAWVYPTALSGYRTVLLKEIAGGLSYSLYANDSTPAASTYINVGTGSDPSALSSGALATNTWTHLAATYDGATLRLFVNGSQAASRAASGILTSSTQPLRIGGNAVWGEYFQGRIDEVRIYGRALSATEIQADMGTAVGGGSAPTTYSLSGVISPVSAGDSAAVTVSGNGITLTRTADALGRYSITGLAPGTYVVSVSKAGYTFSPATQSIQITNSSVAANFTGAATAGGIGLIQKAFNGFEWSVSSISATFSSANAPGSFLIVAGTAARPAGTITISDTAGNTYIPAIGPVTDPAQDVTAYIWYVPSAVGGSNTVTLSPSSARAMEIHVSEWSGVSPVSPLDQTSWATGTGTQVSSGSRPTGTNGELVFGLGWVVNEASPGTGFTALSLINGDLDEYVIQSTAGPVAATFTQDAGDWLALMATFRPAASTSGDADPPTVAVTAPVSGATVSGTVTVAANAADNVGVAGVQFEIDGVPLGPEDTASPYTYLWNSSTTGNGPHTVRAVARDAAGNRSTSEVVVSVSNSTGPSTVGAWSAPVDVGLVAVDMVLLHTGKVLMFGGENYGGTTATVWDPITNARRAVPNYATNIFCSGHSQMADGRILVVGGHDNDAGILGSAEVNIFDPVSESWMAAPSMSFRRWYPTATTLQDGRVLVSSGATSCFTCIADIPEVYSPATNSWTRLNAAQLAFPYYPFMFVLPDGRVINAGAGENPFATWALQVPSQTWTLIDGNVVDGGSAAMYRPGQIIKTGTSATTETGSAPSARTAYVIDMTSNTPAWRQVASMAFPRAYHNMTILPDGDVLVTGGGTNVEGKDVSAAVYEAELWSPATETFRTMARMSVPRLYHGTALLLPDGRVVVAGSGDSYGGPNQNTAEFYSPPYLFKGARPVISSAPSQIAPGQSFTVTSPDAASVTSISLIRLGSVTHQFDEDQRYLSLPFTRSGQDLLVNGPGTSSVAPPGYYMLFLVNGTGVPSVAAIVKVLPVDADSTPPSAPAGLSTASNIGSIALSWSAAIDNVAVVAYNVHRSTIAGFTPSTANRIARVQALTHVDAAGSGSYYYRVTAEDEAGNVSAASNEAFGTALLDAEPPTVGVTSPGAGADITGTVTITASASDNVGVAGVQFKVDGVNVASEDVTAPYQISWNSATVANGPHVITAIGRDAAGNTATSLDVAVNVANTQQAPVGLVAAYGFNEGTGLVAADASGRGHTGTVSSATWVTAGRHGGALAFNGTSSMVSIPDAADLDFTTAVTIEAWVNPSAAGGWRTVVLKERAGGLAYALYGSDDASRPAGYVYSGGADREATGTASLPLNVWSHVALTYNGATLRLFVNGVEVRSQALSGSIAISGSMLRIGGNTVWGEFFAGRIDEVRIYNRALTAAEIQIDMELPVSGS